MAARLKDKGIEELGSFKARVLRQHGLKRIGREEQNWLVEHIEEIERYVGKMKELPELEGQFF